MHRPSDRGLRVPSIETLLIFAAVALAMNISPGPSNLYVMSTSIAQGPGAGVVSAAGLAAGSLVHVVAAAFGLSVIFRASATAYALLQLAGAAYLVWLGIGYLRKRPSTALTPERLPRRSRLRILRESALVEILNPKTALFFLALLPQFVDTAAGSVVAQVLLLGLIVTLTAIPCDLLVAFASGSLAKALRRHPAYGRIQDWVAGSVLVALGVWVAISRRAA